MHNLIVTLHFRYTTAFRGSRILFEIKKKKTKNSITRYKDKILSPLCSVNMFSRLKKRLPTRYVEIDGRERERYAVAIAVIKPQVNVRRTEKNASLANRKLRSDAFRGRMLKHTSHKLPSECIREALPNALSRYLAFLIVSSFTYPKKTNLKATSLMQFVENIPQTENIGRKLISKELSHTAFV